MKITRPITKPVIQPLTGGVTGGVAADLRGFFLRDVAFLGDSRVQLAEQRLFSSSSADWKGLATANGWCGFGISAAGTGTLEYRAADKHFRWTAPGDTAGPWTAGFAGKNVLESGTANKWMMFGLRSLIAAPGTDQTVSITISGANRTFWRQQGFATWVMSGMRWLGNAPKILGLSGNNTTENVEQLPWLQTQATGPGFDVFMLSTNDINASTPSATIIANLQTLYDARRALGRKLVLVNESARWGTAVGTPMTSTQQSIHLDVNNFIATYAAANGCLLVDAYTLTRDPGFSDRRPLTQYLLDTVHLSDLGGELVGVAVANAIAGLIGPGYLRTAGDTNLLPSGILSGTGGSFGAGVSGTVATGWNITRASGDYTVAASVVARTDGGAGSWQQMVFSGGTTAGYTGFLASPSPTLASLGLAVGDSIYFECEVESTGLSGVQGIDAYAVFNGAAVASETSSTLNNSAASRVSDFTARLRSPITRIPEGTTSINCMTRVQIAAGGVAGTVRTGSLAIVKV